MTELWEKINQLYKGWHRTIIVKGHGNLRFDPLNKCPPGYLQQQFKDGVAYCYKNSTTVEKQGAPIGTLCGGLARASCGGLGPNKCPSGYSVSEGLTCYKSEATVEDASGTVGGNMGQNDKAEEIFQTLLDHRMEDEEKGAIYHELAMIKDKQAKYREALSFYEKSLAIKEKIFPPNDFHLAVSYNNIGLVYFNMKNYTKALSFHEKALAIRQQSLPSNHLDLAMSYNNIGLVYSNTNHYSKALSYYEKALEIAQQSLPSTHPHLAASYNNIGSLHESMRNYSKALPYYEKCLEIKQQSLPSSHPDLALSYNNIGLLYEKMKDYPKARSFFERAVLTVQQSLPSNHPWSREMISNFRRLKAIR
ncbi:unnamed protein product [Adineta ricciae]|uniref:Uncharacterized protein n=1 Tax=Adineta ricciae TaxID=249248 RepID=A0A815TC36_ADIRI|nr:unnamed protein product [Adineta ricciae]